MKSPKFWIIAVGAFVAVVGAVVAIYIFRNEIAYFFADIKAKIEEKLLHRNSAEYSDYVDA